jgi:hypothetical protein
VLEDVTAIDDVNDASGYWISVMSIGTIAISASRSALR